MSEGLCVCASSSSSSIRLYYIVLWGATKIELTESAMQRYTTVHHASQAAIRSSKKKKHQGKENLSIMKSCNVKDLNSRNLNCDVLSLGIAMFT